MRRSLIAALVLTIIAPRVLQSQERGATALRELVDGLPVTARVLVIGAHPDDEDTQLISWLSRGRHVETAYLSLTRGDGGQNLIGNELGEALGVIRTEELLAARRIDGARQFFTRAYDFGFSKSAQETFRHWPKDSLLADVVAVVREFRPHVIVSVFSGTPRDGHGQHQAAGILAREAYEIAGDTVRIPARRTGGAGPWTVSKLYRSAWFDPDAGTLRIDVGEYSPLLGRSFAEIAGESRSQHKSQAFGVLQRKGPVFTHVRREATRVAAPADPKAERSIFDGIDTSWTRFSADEPQLVQRIQRDIAAARMAVRDESLAVAAHTLASLARLAPEKRILASMGGAPADLAASLARLSTTARTAAVIASGLAVEATVPRELLAWGDSVPLRIVLYNRGTDTLRFDDAAVLAPDLELRLMHRRSAIAPAGTDTLNGWIHGRRVTAPTWLTPPRNGDVFAAGEGEQHQLRNAVLVSVSVRGARLSTPAPIVHRFADPVRGEVQRPIAVAPPITVTLAQVSGYARAGVALDRVIRAELRSSSAAEQRVALDVETPAGVTALVPSEPIVLPPFGRRTVEVRLRGQLPEGSHPIRVAAVSNGTRYRSGYTEVDYEHIRPQRIYRLATLSLQAVRAVVPEVAVAYIAGVSDNVAPALRDLGVDVTTLDPAALPAADLSRFGTIVVGPRAYESSEALVAANAKLLEWVRSGGRLVVQYGQYEMMRPGMMPYPVTIHRPHDRVTDERAPVRILSATAPAIAGPNRITAADFEGWVQERSLYMPRTFDERYVPLLEMNDPGEQGNRGAILVAPYGKGRYVYTTLSLFRQLPAGVPGAARLMLNLLVADAAPRPTASRAAVPSSGRVRP